MGARPSAPSPHLIQATTMGLLDPTQSDEVSFTAAPPLTAGVRPPANAGPQAAIGDRRRRGRERGGQRRADTFRLYFANVTSWNSGVQEYAQEEGSWMGESEVVCLVETHLKGGALVQAVKRMDKIGYKASMVSAVVTPDAVQDMGE